MTYFELSPAYGRDYRAAKDAKADWAAGKDWIGDYALGFKPVNVSDIPKPCVVILRYQGGTRCVAVKVPA